MDNKHKKNRRRLFIILGIGAVLLLIGLFSVNRALEGLVKKEFYTQLNANPNSLYNFQFEDVKINIFTGSIQLVNIQVIPSDSAFGLLHEGKIKKLIQSKIAVFRILHMNILQFIKERIIMINEIDISGFRVEYLINTKAKEPENKNSLALHHIFSDQFKGASVGAIHVNAEAIDFYHIDQRDSTFFTIDTVQIQISGISMDPETLKNPIPISFNEIRINTGHFSLNSMKYYTIFTKDVRIDVEESSLRVDGFKLIPKYSKSDYNKIIKYNNDWFSISTESVTFNGLSLDELEFDQLLSFASVNITGPVIEIYRDKRLPDAPFKYKPLLGGLIHKIPMDINIDSLLITGGKLKYEEQTDASDQPGTVFFDPMSISVFHLTNNPELIAQNPTMEVDFQGRIMAEAELSAKVNIDLGSTQEEFSINGTLAPVSGTVFNPMVENLLPVKIISADVSNTAFSFTANDDISKGELIMEYDDLKVEVIKGKENDKRAGLISVVANGLIKGKNLPDQGKYHTGNIRFERRKDKAVVNFLWNSCKTGIISIIAPIADRTKKDERKELREEKKEEKKTRREDKKD